MITLRPFPADARVDANPSELVRTITDDLEYEEWWTWGDSNPRPSECHSDSECGDAACVAGHFVFRSGVETLTSCESGPPSDDNPDHKIGSDPCAFRRTPGTGKRLTIGGAGALVDGSRIRTSDRRADSGGQERPGSDGGRVGVGSGRLAVPAGDMPRVPGWVSAREGCR